MGNIRSLILDLKYEKSASNAFASLFFRRICASFFGYWERAKVGLSFPLSTLNHFSLDIFYNMVRNNMQTPRKFIILTPCSFLPLFFPFMEIELLACDC